MDMSDHPEIKKGEVWLTNGTIETFELVKYKSKRMGEQAYNPINGEPIKDSIKTFPIFVNKGEYEAKLAEWNSMKDPNRIERKPEEKRLETLKEEML